MKTSHTSGDLGQQPSRKPASLACGLGQAGRHCALRPKILVPFQGDKSRRSE
jgi:hypothetical protein